MVEYKWCRPTVFEHWTKLLGAKKKDFDFELKPAEILVRTFIFPFHTLILTSIFLSLGWHIGCMACILALRVMKIVSWIMNVSFPTNIQCLKIRLILDFFVHFSMSLNLKSFYLTVTVPLLQRFIFVLFQWLHSWFSYFLIPFFFFLIFHGALRI